MGDIRLTIFEDSKHLSESLQIILNGTPGFICSGAWPDCNDLLHRIENDRPNIVLMDIEMPGMNGSSRPMCPRAPMANTMILLLRKKRYCNTSLPAKAIRSLRPISGKLQHRSRDNGPAPNFRQDRSTGMRGAKLSLYEAGIRMPFIVWGYSKIAKGKTDSVSVIAAVDLMPSFARLAGIDSTLQNTDGEDRSKVLMGKPLPRKHELYWEYGRNDISFNYPGAKNNRSPQLAIRDGKWKLLMNIDGSGLELYDLSKHENEDTNLAVSQPEITASLKQKLRRWWDQLPAYEKH